MLLSKNELLEMVRDEAQKVYKEHFHIRENVDGEKLFTVKEAAEYLRVREETVRVARRERRLQGVMINEKMWGFRKKDLDSYLVRYRRVVSH